jgi:hypothetical protein
MSTWRDEMKLWSCVSQLASRELALALNAFIAGMQAMITTDQFMRTLTGSSLEFERRRSLHSNEFEIF